MARGIPLAMVSGKLNIFQRLVRQWDALHPYNAAQILHLAGPADSAGLAAAWEQTIASLGLGRVRLSGSRYRCESLNGDLSRYTVRIVPAAASLEDRISEELNQPFDEADGVPFRPFVLPQPDGTYYAGVTYHHWFADSVSVRLLLREWFLRLHEPDKARHTPFMAPPGGYWKLFGAPRGTWRFQEGLFSSLRWTARFKHVRRIRADSFRDLRVRFELHRLPDGWVERLLAWSRAHQLTLNDLLLAAIAEACDQHLPTHASSRRPNLGLGTIVDLRSSGQRDLSETFGLFLGFTAVICQPQDLRDFAQLAQTIARQNALQKAGGTSQSSMIRMAAGLVAGSVLPKPRLLDFYRKRVPLAGGISNVNLNRSWASAYHPQPLLDYIRVSPTGPMLPLVFTPSTLGNSFHFGLTYRPSVVAPDQMQALVGAFRQRLAQLVAE